MVQVQKEVQQVHGAGGSKVSRHSEREAEQAGAVQAEAGRRQGAGGYRIMLFLLSREKEHAEGKRSPALP